MRPSALLAGLALAAALAFAARADSSGRTVGEPRPGETGPTATLHPAAAATPVPPAAPADGPETPRPGGRLARVGGIAGFGRGDVLNDDFTVSVAAQAAIWSVDHFNGRSSRTETWPPGAASESDGETAPSLSENQSRASVSGDGARVPASSVPEASTWAMMGLGFAALAYAGFHRVRRERRARYAL